MDHPPILPIAHPLLQPVRVVPQPILLVSLPRYRLADALVRHDQGEDGEGSHGKDQQEEEEDVDAEEDGVPEARADDAQHRHDEKEDAHDEEGQLEEPLAFRGGLDA